MDECIRDLGWMPANWYLIHVSSVEGVLPGDEESFSIFLQILLDAGRAWANPETRGLGDTEAAVRKPFNVIISGKEEGLLRVKKTLAVLEKAR